MVKACRHCQQNFEVTDTDLKFLEKISPVFSGKKYLVPSPTLCPDCRQQRRLAFRNERNLYRRKSSLSEQEIISIYSKEKPYTVYSQEEWWSDTWDGLEYGREFNFSELFFAQFQKLSLEVPRVSLINNTAENSPYCNFADGNKNCHLVINSNWNQDSLYSTLILNCPNVSDAFWVLDSELCYECVDSEKCYDVKFSRECHECRNSAFLSECRSCKNCLGCVNLRNKSYHIWNEPVTPEAFEQKITELENWGNLQKFAQEFAAFVQTKPHPSTHSLQSEDILGDHLSRCHNAFHCFDGFDSESCTQMYDFVKCKNCTDGNSIDSGELCYENTSLIGYGNSFTAYCRDSSGLFYCWDCHSCQDCFGCIGLQHKKYCLLNREYSKEQYEELLPKIIEHMMKTPLLSPLTGGKEGGQEWGEFFPVVISPFGYNETTAQEYFPLSQEQVREQKWQWKEPENPDFSGVTKKIPAEKLPEIITEIPDDILNWAITCEISKKPFRIQKAELEFYRKMNLPI